MTDPGDELVEVVSASGEVEMVVPRSRMRVENLLHRNVVIVLRRPSGAVVVHQRASWKDVHPSYWDLAFGGVPAVGETYPDAAARELAEEAGLVVETSRLRDRGEARFTGDSVRWVGRVYEVVDDRPVHPADGEVAGWDEIEARDLARWAAQRPVCPDSLDVVLPLVTADLD